MNNKFFICIVALLFVFGGVSQAQSPSEVNANKSDDFGFYIGLVAPMQGGSDFGSEVSYGLTYGHFSYSGIGYRVGFQYVPSLANIDDSFGFPIAFVYRTPDRSSRERLTSAAYGAAYSMVTNPYRGVDGFLSSIFVNLFSRAELSVGVTPGFVAGEADNGITDSGEGESWVEKNSSFLMSIDAGAGFNYRIWRFDLKIMPAFHYLITDNYVSCTSSLYGSDRKEDTLHWLFTLNVGLAYKF